MASAPFCSPAARSTGSTRADIFMRFHVILPALGLCVLARGVAPDWFVEINRPVPAIYHAGWVDLNKNGAKDPYEDAALPTERRIDDLLARMTTEEKTMQLVTLYGYGRVLMDELPTPEWDQALWKDGIGNIDEHVNGLTENARTRTATRAWPPSLHARTLNEVQRFFIERTRLGIPADFSNEGIRGLLHDRATSFPAQTGVGSTWSRELAAAVGTVVGREARALGYTNIYAPILDLARDPRWGRVTECFGEEPWLASELGVAQARALQAEGVVSTLKHFAVYSVPKGGRDGLARTDPHETWPEVQSVHLQPFRRAIREAGALGVMASYNDYAGVPIASSGRFLTDILRGEYGFQGYVVSDSRAVEFLYDKHYVAPSIVEGARQMIAAGLNVRTGFTQPALFINPLREAIRRGDLPVSVVDARVRDVLRVKFWLGLFDRPYVADPAAADRIVRAPEHLALAERVADEALVLLKNDGGLLPLKRGLKKILVAGPNAADTHGLYSRYGPQNLKFVSVLDGIRQAVGPGTEVVHVEGCKLVDANFPESDILREPPSGEVAAGIAVAAEAARGADVAVVVVGESDAIARESKSRLSLDLPGHQEHLIRAIHATGTPVVVVLINGRPLSINWTAKRVPAILEAWFPGENGGSAIARALFGDTNPAGRLTMTFPRSVGQLPMNFPAKVAAQADGETSRAAGVLFPFGHGLSYTTFAYSNLAVTPAKPRPGEEVTVTADITNTGARAGDEVAQLYVRDAYASVTPYELQLRGFERIHLKPGETKTVSFKLGQRELELFNDAGQWVVEPGLFVVHVGASSADLRLQGSFYLGATKEEEIFPAKNLSFGTEVGASPRPR